MTNLGLDLLILTMLLIYFGVFMTQNIYEQYEKAYLRKLFFAANQKVILIAFFNKRLSSISKKGG